MIREQILTECKQAISKDEGTESILSILRGHGISKVESMKYLVDLGICNLANAKVIVHESQVWSDVKDRDERFQNSLKP